MPTPRRILLIRLSHLGDVIQALPLFHALRAAYPEAALAWAVQEEFADLVGGLPGLERVITFSRKGGLGAWAAMGAELAAFAPDWTVDAQGNTKSALTALCSGAPRRTGLARRHWREGFAAGSSTDLAPAPQPGRAPLHGLERVLLLARHCAGPAGLPQAPFRRDPGLAPRELADGRRALSAGLASPTPSAPESGTPAGAAAPILLHLSRAGDPRSWPAEHFADLVDLLAPHLPLLVLAGPAEEAEAAALEDRDIPVMRQAGQRQLAGILAAAAAVGGRLVAGDSGPAHLAAAVDLPVTLLAGPQDAGLTGPWPLPASNRAPASHHRVLRRGDLHCSPCRSRTCTAARGPICMTELTPATVVEDLLRPAPGEARERAQDRDQDRESGLETRPPFARTPSTAAPQAG